MRTRADAESLYLRGRIWWTWVHGRRRSTGCTDHEAAVHRRAELQRTLSRPWTGEYVYFLRAPDGRIKIGHTTQPGQRWKGIRRRIGAEHALEVLAVIHGDRRTEAAILRGFARFCVGEEWHSPATELLAFVAALGGERADEAPVQTPAELATHILPAIGVTQAEVDADLAPRVAS